MIEWLDEREKLKYNTLIKKKKGKKKKRKKEKKFFLYIKVFHTHMGWGPLE